jgi:carbon-monoxide dehydrogenase medium subunit
MVTDVELPKLPPGTGWAFAEVARRAGDFALAAVGVTISARDGKAAQVRIAMMGVGETPLRAPEAETLLAGRAIDAAAIEQAAAAMQAIIAPNTDLHASADYRHFLIGALARRAIDTAWRRALGELS